MSNASLHDPAKKIDIGKALIQDGFIIVEKFPGRRYAKIVRIWKIIFIILLNYFSFQQVGEYKEAEQSARKQHIGIWKYGDM